MIALSHSPDRCQTSTALQHVQHRHTDHHHCSIRCWPLSWINHTPSQLPVSFQASTHITTTRTTTIITATRRTATPTTTARPASTRVGRLFCPARLLCLATAGLRC